MPTTKPTRRLGGQRRSMASRDRFPIQEAAERTGLSPAVLRIWENRYKWPMPNRAANGYRYYTAAQIDDLQYVKELMDAGATISGLLADPKIDIMAGNFRARLDQRPAPIPVIDFSDIPRPSTPAGQALRDACELAIRRRHAGNVARALAEAQFLRPAERELAVLALVRRNEEVTAARVAAERK